MNVLSAGTFLAHDIPTLVMPPAWRKATRNMVMATASIKRALSRIPALAIEGNPEIAFVLGSSSGELDTSADFLTTWSKMKMARPVLFQNSLHNATTGFASIHFQLTGPSFTVSALANTPQECVETARGLLREKMCQVCIVTLVEAHKTLAGWIGEEGVLEGACTMVLAETAPEGIVALGALASDSTRLNYDTRPGPSPLVAIDGSGFYREARRLGVNA
jgi:hypothetical protein